MGSEEQRACQRHTTHAPCRRGGKAPTMDLRCLSDRRGLSVMLVALVAAGACQSGPPAAPQGEGSAEPASSTPMSAVSPEANATERAVASVSASAEPASPPASASAVVAPAPDAEVRAACARLCDATEASCSKERAAACRAQCDVHVQRAKGCETETRAALDCQASSKSGLCENIATGACNERFAAMQRCQRGETTTTAATAGLPSGWEMLKDAEWGVSIAMPAGAAFDPAAKPRLLRATADGLTFEVKELARPKKLDDQALLKLVIAHVGVGCQDALHLGGRVDAGPLTLVQYDSGCGKTERLYGSLRIDERRALSLLVRGPSSKEIRRTFFEGVK